MLYNQEIALFTNRILLVPYCKHHVDKYHEWMQDPEIQEATASEPLSLDEEYSMQQSWRNDSDKLTFIICRQVPKQRITATLKAGFDDTDEYMVGDVNIFMSTAESEGGGVAIIGELELMVADTTQQSKGYGRAALLTLLRYVFHHEEGIVREFVSSSKERTSPNQRLSYLCAKIKAQNYRSLALFESLGFRKSTTPNFFGEFELRHDSLSLEAVAEFMTKAGIKEYAEGLYQRGSE